MVSSDQIATSKEIQKRTGTTFYFATRLLPDRVRRATYVLYAFFRIADEVVDGDQSLSADEQATELARLRAEALGERKPEGEVMRAFRSIADRYDIADGDINAFVDAMATDIDTSRYPTYDDLQAYMDGSAGAVGLMMTSIMQPEDPERARPHARALGEAFQLTNFLRDVREDVLDRDRIYLPQTTLERYGVTDEQIERLEMDENFADVMRHELERTEGIYRDGVRGIKLLPSDCQFPVLLAAVLYAEYHRLIRAVDYDVLNNEPSLSLTRMTSLLVKTGFYWLRWHDPERVFDAVSAVECTVQTDDSDRTSRLDLDSELEESETDSSPRDTIPAR
ncbi:MAG: phytoene/squalene synthase family protein [Halobacteriales archaeon]